MINDDCWWLMLLHDASWYSMTMRPQRSLSYKLPQLNITDSWRDLQDYDLNIFSCQDWNWYSIPPTFKKNGQIVSNHLCTRYSRTRIWSRNAKNSIGILHDQSMGIQGMWSMKLGILSPNPLNFPRFLPNALCQGACRCLCGTKHCSSPGATVEQCDPGCRLPPRTIIAKPLGTSWFPHFLVIKCTWMCLLDIFRWLSPTKKKIYSDWFPWYTHSPIHREETQRIMDSAIPAGCTWNQPSYIRNMS